MINRMYTKPPAVYTTDYDDPSNDPTQGRVYGLERAFLGNYADVYLTRKQLQEIANYVCRKARVARIKIEVSEIARPTFCGSYFPREDGIPARLVLFKYRHGCNAMVLAHELSHHIHDSMADGNVDAAHGSVFLGIYRRVLHCLNLIPEYAFDAACRHAKLRAKRFTKIGDL